jgi:hypothetical protein
VYSKVWDTRNTELTEELLLPPTFALPEAADSGVKKDVARKSQ